jgi:hypothetical protein
MDLDFFGRRHPVVPFSLEDIIPFLKGRGIIKKRFLRGGKSSSNYRLILSDGADVVVRYCRGSTYSQLHALRIASDYGILVPEVLFSDCRVMVYRFIPGRHLFWDEDNAFHAGAVLGKMAGIQFSSAGFFHESGNVQPWPFGDGNGFFETMMGHEKVREYLGELHVRQLFEILKENSFLEIDSPPVLVHGDFNGKNLLWTAEAKLCAVIDWEYSHSGSIYMDLGNLIRNMEPRYFDAVERGVKSKGVELPDNWVDVAERIDLSAHLEFLSSDASSVIKSRASRWIEGYISKHLNLLK